MLFVNAEVLEPCFNTISPEQIFTSKAKQNSQNTIVKAGKKKTKTYLHKNCFQVAANSELNEQI